MPLHDHDGCTNCVYLGSIATADMYRCESILGSSYILRYSSELSDYCSHSDYNGRKEQSLRESIAGGDDLYYWRITLLDLNKTGITNLMRNV